MLTTLNQIVLSSQITVHDRPMTQHGLSGMKTASKGRFDK